jgi:hypothetical protein
MTVLPTPTPDMGGYSIALDGEDPAGFDLRVPDGRAEARGCGPADGEGHQPGTGLAVGLRVEDTDQIIAALRQARRVAEKGVDHAWVNAAGDPVEIIPAPTVVPIELLAMSDQEMVQLLAAMPEGMAATVRVIALGKEDIPAGSVQAMLDLIGAEKIGCGAEAVLREALAQVHQDYQRQVCAALGLPVQGSTNG